MARTKASAPATESTVNEGQKDVALGNALPSSGAETANPEPKRWSDPFNPKTGEFADNIRLLKGEDDLTELRDSMKQFGFIEHLPVLVDENDVVLVGHRRLKVAKELGIEPVTKKLDIGQGDAADAERLKLAIASNIGSKPMTKDDRKRIAEYLYGKREWTMERIADALNVSHQTIGRDLEGLSTVDKPQRPKGGRPKGSKGGKGPSRKMPPNPKTEEELRAQASLKPSSEQIAKAAAKQAAEAEAEASALEAKRRLEIEAVGWRSEVEELKAQVDELKEQLAARETAAPATTSAAPVRETVSTGVVTASDLLAAIRHVWRLGAQEVPWPPTSQRKAQRRKKLLSDMQSLLLELYELAELEELAQAEAERGDAS